MKGLVVILFLIVLVTIETSSGERMKKKKEAVFGVSGRPGAWRAVAYEALPNFTYAHGVSIIAAEKNREARRSSFDAISYKMVDPNLGNNDPQCTLYFGFFRAAADINENGRISNAGAALFQMILRFLTVFIWKDVDGNPGFDFVVEPNRITGYCDNVFRYPGDCYLAEYDLSDPLIRWKYLDYVNDTFSIDGEQYDLHEFAAETEDEVFWIRFKVVTHAARVGGISITPEEVKIDVEINYFNNPLFTLPASVVNEPNAKVGLFVATLGNTHHREVNITRGNGHSTMHFDHQVNGEMLKGYFEWEESALVDLTSSPIYDSVFPDYEIMNTTGLVGLALSGLKIIVAIWNSWGWRGGLHYFSWDVDRPTTIQWDPKFGMVASESNATGSNETTLRCFPSDSEVTLEGVGIVPLSEVKVGDRIGAICSGGEFCFSDVYYMPTQVRDGWSQFVSLKHENGRFKATPDHLVFASTQKAVNGQCPPQSSFVPVMSQDVAEGNLLWSQDGCPKVVKNEMSLERGYFSPLTIEGTVIVDGVEASCYSRYHSLGHWLVFFPHRLAYSIFGSWLTDAPSFSLLSWAYIHGTVFLENLFGKALISTAESCLGLVA